MKITFSILFHQCRLSRLISYVKGPIGPIGSLNEQGSSFPEVGFPALPAIVLATVFSGMLGLRFIWDLMGGPSTVWNYPLPFLATVFSGVLGLFLKRRLLVDCFVRRNDNTLCPWPV